MPDFRPVAPHHLLRCDFHVHTIWSPDARGEPAAVIAQARTAGLDRLAITDHHEIRGALEAQALAPDMVIVGEEVTADDGTDLIGLYLTERIPAGGTIEGIAAAIREQGGVVYAPHPCAYRRHTDARWARLLAVSDCFEALNGRAFHPRWNRDARRRIAAAGVPALGASDAHAVAEIGGAYTEIPRFRTAQELQAVLAAARPVQRRAPVTAGVAYSIGLHLASKYLGWHPERPAGSVGSVWPHPDVWGQRSHPGLDNREIGARDER